MEKSEKAKQLRALRKYGKKVRKNTCTDGARPGMPGEVAVVPALCVFGSVGFTGEVCLLVSLSTGSLGTMAHYGAPNTVW